MLSRLLLGLGCTLVACLVRLLIIYRSRGIGTGKRKDPQFQEARGWPLLGNLPEVFAASAHGLEWGAEKWLKHGRGWSFTTPGLRIIDVSKPEWIEYVQKTNFPNYIKGEFWQYVMGDVFGEGIFVADGVKWKRHREASTHIFSNSSYKTIMTPCIHQASQRLTDLLATSVEQGISIDFCDIFHRLTLESFVHMTFGKDLQLVQGAIKLDALEVQGNEVESASEAFAHDFDFVQHQIEWRFTVIMGWSLLESQLFPLGRKMSAARSNLENFAYSLIDERTTKIEKEQLQFEEEEACGDLLALFMRARDGRGTALNRSELKDSALNLIIAGRDTTAQSLSWQFYHLLMNPDFCNKLRKENRQVLDADGHDRVTFDNYRKFTWVLAVICEIQRLHPSVPKNLRFAAKSDQIPNGPYIEAGDGIRWSDWQMGRDKDIWGPDCSEFKPERWIDDQNKLKQFGPYKFHAFNAGPRICLGMNLANFQMVNVTVELLEKFDMKFADGWLESVPKMKPLPGLTSEYPVPMYRSSLTLPMADPMMISVKLRED